MDYAALAKQYGGSSQPEAPSGAPDYASLAAQFGGKTQAGEVPPLSAWEQKRAKAAQQSNENLDILKNIIPGAIRGAGSIGATLLAPGDVLDSLIQGKGLTLDANRQRRADIDNALTNLVGADPNNIGYKVGKVGAEVAGTAGVGGGIANVAARTPIAAAVPNLINAVRTGGMVAGTPAPGVAGAVGNALTRAAGGAITGGASAGLVDPEQAKTGAMIGAALPIAATVAGKVGNAIGKVASGPNQAPDLVNAIQKARDAGYVIPPSQANPTLLNRVLEGTAGKITTAQNASARNAVTTASIVADDLGLPVGTKITPDVLNGIRQQAGQAYEAVGLTGTMQPGPAYEAALDQITAKAKLAQAGFPGAKPSPVIEAIDSLRSKQFDASSAVAKISSLRAQADAAYVSGNKELGSALKAGAGALEDAIDSHLQQLGVPPEMLQGFRDARQLIAKTYSVQKALNPETGSIDARILASQLKQGKPLSGGLKDAAQFAARFPKANQTVEAMGSLPQTSPLDWAVGSGLSAATANPLAMASMAVRPAARALALSPLVQNRLLQSAGQNPIQRLLANPDLQQLGYRAAPIALSDR